MALKTMKKNRQNSYFNCECPFLTNKKQRKFRKLFENRPSKKKFLQ